MIKLFPMALAVGIVYVLVQTRRGARHARAVKLDRPKARVRRGDGPWYALLTPLLPIVLAFGFAVPIVPSLLAGVVYGLVTTTKWRELNGRALRSLYQAFDAAAPADRAVRRDRNAARRGETARRQERADADRVGDQPVRRRLVCGAARTDVPVPGAGVRPTSTQTVWAAQYSGVRPERAMASTLPYTWAVALDGMVLTAVLYLSITSRAGPRR